MRWCFDNDDDGHWYMLPADRLEEFERWNDKDTHTLDFEQYRIGGHPSQFSFSEPSKPMRRLDGSFSARYIQGGLREIALREILSEVAARIPHDQERTVSPPPTKGLISWKCVPNCLRCRLDSFQQAEKDAPTFTDTVQYRSQLEQARQECVGLRAEVNELRGKLGMGQKYSVEIG